MSVDADTIRVAVASNFSTTAKSLATEFERLSGHDIVLLIGSSGKHVAQIQNGLGVDVFLAADSARPKSLEAQGFAVPATRFTYAIGRLALWSALQTVDESTLEDLGEARVAIANAKLAPYGLAAEQVLNSLSYLPDQAKKLVRGENVSQAYQFVKTKNVHFGLVAWSQLKLTDEQYWLIPAELHQTIEQQAILLNDTPAGRSFLKFLRSAEARNTIAQHGYERPSKLP